MAKDSVVINNDFFAGLGKDPGVEDLCHRATEAIAAQARAKAPVDTGDYRDSITVEKRQSRYRTVFRVVADSDHAMGVEARTGNLARALNGTRVY